MADKLNITVLRKTFAPIVIVFLLLLAFWLGRVTTNGKGNGTAVEEAHSDVRESARDHAESEAPSHAEDATPHHPEGKETHGSPPARGSLNLSSEERGNIGLRTVAADLRVIESVVRVPGLVKADPDREAQVSSRVAGISVAVFTRVGDRVRKGQKLAEIESVEIQKLQVDIIQAENRMLLTMAELDRVKRLVASKIAAEKELITAQNQHQAILNEVEGLAQQLKLLGLPEEVVQKVRKEKSVSTFALRSPISGVVAERHVVLGETVEPNKVIFKILDSSVVFVEGDAFEEALPQLRIGQKVRIRVASYPGEVFTGRISRVSPTIDPQKRTIHLWVQVRNPAGILKPGLFAEMDVVIGGGGEVLSIPFEALISTEGESFVFVAAKGSFHRADVILGAKDDRYVEVKTGLFPGDRVVTDGKQQIYTKSLMARQGGAALGGHGH